MHGMKNMHATAPRSGRFVVDEMHGLCDDGGDKVCYSTTEFTCLFIILTESETRLQGNDVCGSEVNDE
jgi:hypothetical protein